jgi:subtilisin-like proprotein convertase family protein
VLEARKQNSRRLGQTALALLATSAALAVVAAGPASSAQHPLGTVDLLNQANLTIHGAAVGDQAGTSVAGAGDVNGDGRTDVIVGAQGADAAYVLYGKATGGTVTLSNSGLAASDGFLIKGAVGDAAGNAVAGAGDVNGDGRADVIVGARSAAGNTGAAYVVYGKPTGATVTLSDSGLAASDGFLIKGAASDDLAGSSVAGAGDVNGDGRADVIVGALFADASGGQSGAAYVLYGKPTGATITLSNSGLAAADGFLIKGAAMNDGAGGSVAGAGDVNGDGRPDVLVGSYSAAANGSQSGAAYVLYGKTTNTTVTLSDTSLAASDGFLIKGAAMKDEAGLVAGAGDVNGDGRADVIVGALYANTNGVSSGAAYVLYGKPTGATVTLNNTAIAAADGFLIKGAAPSNLAGASVAGAGDVNGDLVDDVLVGAPQPLDTPGQAYLVIGAGFDPVFTAANTTPITSPGAMPGNQPATPYPSNIVMSGAEGLLARVRVTLSDFSHTAPDDFDVLLVSPTGQKIKLMSDVGGTTGVTHQSYSFIEPAVAFMPHGTALASGTFKPTEFETAQDFFDPPAPAAPWDGTLSDLADIDPNGTWKLFVVDDHPSNDIGGFAGGWKLEVATTPGAPTHLDAASYSASESAGSVPVTVVRDANTATASVRVTTGGGSASAGSDYGAVNQTVSFAANETQKTVNVPIVNDSTHEGDETVNVSLSNLTGDASPAAPSSAALTIHDDDPAPAGGAGGGSGSGAGGAGDGKGPTESALALVPPAFAAAPSGSSISKKRFGAKVSYRLSEAATTTFTVERRRAGRSVGRKCKAPSRRNRRKRPCKRFVRVRGSITHRGATGANSFHFSGRLRGRKLALGRYRLVAVPRDGAGKRGAAVRTKFRIIRGRRARTGR